MSRVIKKSLPRAPPSEESDLESDVSDSSDEAGSDMESFDEEMDSDEVADEQPAQLPQSDDSADEEDAEDPEDDGEDPDDSGEDSEDDGEERILDLDDDEELQLAFAKGLLKPGLNAIGPDTKKKFVNDEAGLLSKLKSFKLNLPWIEVLTMTVQPAPMAPELALEEQEHANKRLKMFEARAARKASKGKKRGFDNSIAEADSVHNDFKREVGFYRLAQAAVLAGLPNLKAEGAKTRKPADYFAEMSKSDEHMQRVRHKLLDEEKRAEESAKARRLRELKKFGKQTQVAVLQRRTEEKRQLMDQIKKFRKGQKDALNFLDQPGAAPPTGAEKKKGPASTKHSRKKRMSKDTKYGFGGQKKRSKYNTKESAGDVSGYFPKSGGKMGQKGPQKPGGNFRGAMSNPRSRPSFKAKKGPNRPGKMRRQRMKAK